MAKEWKCIQENKVYRLGSMELIFDRTEGSFRITKGHSNITIHLLFDSPYEQLSEFDGESIFKNWGKIRMAPGLPRHFYQRLDEMYRYFVSL